MDNRQDEGNTMKYRAEIWIMLFLMLTAWRGFADAYQEGFETWQVIDTVADKPWLEPLVKNGWFGDKPPYVCPPVEFQMGPGRIFRREGLPGKEVAAGKYAFGIVTGDKPVNILMPWQIPIAKAGQRYRVAFWAKGNGTVRCRAYEYGRKGPPLATPFFKTCVIVPGEWKQSTALFEPTVSDAAVWVLVLEISANASVDLDEISVGPDSGKQLSFPKNVPAPVADNEMVAVAFPVQSPVTIDGRIDEPCWKTAEWHTGFLRHTDQGSLALVQGQFAFLYGPDTLYFAFVSGEQGLDPGKTNGGYPVELFLDPGATRDLYYQFACKVGGKCYQNIRMDSFTCPWETQGIAELDRWSVEAAIPFSSIGRKTPEIGELWTCNVCRNGPYMGPWAPVGPRYHSPEGFALLTFGGYERWWLGGAGPRMTEKLRKVSADSVALAKNDREITAQVAEAGGLLKSIVPAKGSMPDRPQFLQVFRQAEKLGRILQNVEHELRWMQSLKTCADGNNDIQKVQK